MSAVATRPRANRSIPVPATDVFGNGVISNAILTRWPSRVGFRRQARKCGLPRAAMGRLPHCRRRRHCSLRNYNHKPGLILEDGLWLINDSYEFHPFFPLKFLHEIDEHLCTFDGHGIVNRCSQSADRAMSFEPDQVLLLGVGCKSSSSSSVGRRKVIFITDRSAFACPL